MPAIKWLRLLMNHIPDRYDHLVRYYGYYSNRSRGARRLIENADDTAGSIHIDEPPANTCRKAAWARLVQKVVAPGHPWPPQHWHFRVRRTRSIRLRVLTAATTCASSRSSTIRRDRIPDVSLRTGAPEEYSGQTVRTGDGRIAKIREIGHARCPDQVPNHAATNPGPRLTRSFGPGTRIQRPTSIHRASTTR